MMAEPQPPSAGNHSVLDKQVYRRKFLAGALKHGLITAPTIALVLSAAATPAKAQFSYAASDATRVGPQGFSNCSAIQNPVERFFCHLQQLLSGPRGGDPPGTTTGIRG